MAFERHRKNGVDDKKQRLVTSRLRGESITLIFGEATMKIRAYFWSLSSCAQLHGLDGS